MTGLQHERLALRLLLFTLAVFVLMRGIQVSSGVSQEPLELFRPPADHVAALLEAGEGLRLVLFLDLLFLLGYGAALATVARAHAARNPAFAWAAGVGIVLVAVLDLAENTVMLHSLEIALGHGEIGQARVVLQAGVSAMKWQLAAISVVALSFVLPRDTGLERLLVWTARLLLPLGAGLFVTGAGGARVTGGLLILLGMGGGLALLALTIWLRQLRTVPDEQAAAAGQTPPG